MQAAQPPAKKRSTVKLIAFAMIALALVLVLKTKISPNGQEVETENLIGHRADSRSLDPTAGEGSREQSKSRLQSRQAERKMSPEAREILDSLENLRRVHLSGHEQVPRGEFTNLIYRYAEAGGPPGEILNWLEDFASIGNVQDPDDHELARIASYTASLLSKQNGRMVSKWIDEHIDDPAFDSNKLVYSASLSWISDDSRAASQWVELHADKLQDHHLKVILSKWDPADLGGCLDWIDQQIASESGLISGYAISSITKKWARNNLKAASNWVSSLPEEMRRSGYSQIVAAWPEEDMSSAIEWVSQHEGNTAYDGARSGLARRHLTDDPIAALEIANGILNTGGRKSSVYAAARFYYEQDPVSAQAWLTANGHQDILRNLRR
ncbi:MAG: hypothetical protein AB8D78_00510 [Akkermansiaceae bacterium]